MKPQQFHIYSAKIQYFLVDSLLLILESGLTRACQFPSIEKDFFIISHTDLSPKSQPLRSHPNEPQNNISTSRHKDT